MAWAPSYATALELWNYGDTTNSEMPAAQEEQLTKAATGASRAVDTHCSGAVKRQFGKAEAPVTRYYTPYYNDERGRYCVEMDDLASDTGLTVSTDGVAIPATDCVLLPRNAAPDGYPYTHLVLPSSLRPEEVALTTDQWGWLSFPDAVVQATLMQGWRLFMRRVSPFGVAGSPEAGSELRLLSRLDPDVAVLLRGYGRSGGVL